VKRKEEKEENPDSSMNWRIIDLKDADIYRLHAAEDYFLNKLNRENHPPTILFSRLSNSCISIGNAQNLEKDVNLEQAKLLNVDITRRKTGGRSAYLDNDHYIVSLINKKASNDLDITKKYVHSCNKIIDSIKRVTGIELYLKNQNDLITLDNKKVGGAAQRIKSRSYLVHCYIRHKKNLDNMLKIIMVDSQPLTQYKKEFDEFTGSIEELSKGHNNFYDSFRSNFLTKFEPVNKSTLNEEEIKEIKGIEGIYKNQGYIFGKRNEPSRGNCDLIAGNTLKIKDLESKVNYV
jgi:lipoate-protein ligase A